MTYPEVYSRLNFELAVITFFKKDGQIRIMLGTRNLNTVSLKYGFQGVALGGHDKRCNINNGNVAVFDMLLGEARSFNINRVIDIQYAGVVSIIEDYEKALANFTRYKEEYEKNNPRNVDLDNLV